MQASAEPGAGGAMRSWAIVALLTFLHLVSFLDRAIVIVMMPDLKASFALSDAELGLIYGTGFVVLYSVATVAMGHIVDRHSRKRVILFGLIAWTLSTAAFAIAQVPWQLFLARVTVGLGEACLVPAAVSMIADVVRPARSGRALALFLVGPSLGTTIALVLGGIAIGQLQAAGGYDLFGIALIEPWRALTLAAALPGVVGIGLMMMVREPMRVATPVAQSDDTDLSGSWRTGLGLHMLAFSCFLFVAQATIVWGPIHFQRDLGWTQGEANIFIGAALFFITPAAIMAGGAIYDRLTAGRRDGSALPLVTSIAVALAAAGLAASVILPGQLQAVPVLLFFGFLLIANPCLLIGVTAIAPPARRGLATGAFMAVVTLVGVGGGPPFVGWLSDHVFTGAGGLMSALQLTALAFGAVTIATVWINRRAYSARKEVPVPRPAPRALHPMTEHLT